MGNFIYPQVKCPEFIEGQFYLYLLECTDNSIYTGSSGNLKQRLKTHNDGKASEWTKMRRPVRWVYYEIHPDLLTARRRELQIKGWSKKKKENLINGKWGKK